MADMLTLFAGGALGSVITFFVMIHVHMKDLALAVSELQKSHDLSKRLADELRAERVRNDGEWWKRN